MDEEVVQDSLQETSVPEQIINTQTIKQASIQPESLAIKPLTPKELVAPKLKRYNTLRRDTRWERKTFVRGAKRFQSRESNEAANDLAKTVSAVKTAEISRTKRQKIMYKAHGLKLGFIYRIHQTWAKYLACVVVGILAGLIAFLLLKNTGTYSSGLGGISQGIARIVQVVLAKNEVSTATIEATYNAMFWGIILLLNIPLLIFAYFKIDKQFALMTAVFIVTQNLVGLALGYIPNTESLFIFGSTAGGIEIAYPSYILSKPEIMHQLNKALQIVTWAGSDYDVVVGQGARIVSVFAYALVFSLFNGVYLAAIYILGGSSGGTDVVATYISKVKVKSIGGILTYFNLASLVIGVAIGSFTPVMMLGGLTPATPGAPISWMSYLGLFFSPNLLASLLGTIIAGLTLNALFPKHKAVKAQVYSKDTRLIANAIHADGWSHQVAVNNSDDSLSWTSKTSLETFCFYLELPNLIKTIRNVDKEALILIYPVADIDGEMVTTVSK